MAIHDELTEPIAIHPAAFVGATDPALDSDNGVSANKLWIDTTVSPYTLKIRNAGNTAWQVVNGNGSATSSAVAMPGFFDEGEEGPPGPPFAVALPSVVLGEVVVGGGGAASVTFSGIPGTYRHLKIAFLARTDNAAVQTLGLQFNGDTGSNYDSQFLSATATTATASESIGATSIGIGVCTASGAQAGAFATGTIDIPYYALTTNDKVAISQFILVSTTASGGVVSRYRQGAWRTASAVTSLVLTPAAGSLVQDSRFTLYGVL